MCSFQTPSSNSNGVYPSETFFQIWDFPLVFLIYRVKPLIMFCPENDPLKLKRPNPSETFEMSLRGGSGNYTITVNFMKKIQKISKIKFVFQNFITLFLLDIFLWDFDVVWKTFQSIIFWKTIFRLTEISALFFCIKKEHFFRWKILKNFKKIFFFSKF